MKMLRRLLMLAVIPLCAAASLMAQSCGHGFALCFAVAVCRNSIWTSWGRGGQELRLHGLHHGLDNGPAGERFYRYVARKRPRRVGESLRQDKGCGARVADGLCGEQLSLCPVDTDAGRGKAHRDGDGPSNEVLGDVQQRPFDPVSVRDY